VVAEGMGLAATVGTVSSDTWVTTQIKSKILFAEEIRSLNYSIKTVAGVVYVMGLAQNQKELDHVLKIVSETKSVSKVVNYVKLNTDAD
jgi:osmotically-inducible protein OsmY